MRRSWATRFAAAALLLTSPAGAGGLQQPGVQVSDDPLVWTGDHTFDGLVDIGTVETFDDLDATPDVSTGIYWNTFTNALTITDFGGSPADGQKLYVFSKAAITFDCTGAGLDCGDTDGVTASGDATYWVFTGTNWQLMSFLDVSANMFAPGGAIGKQTLYLPADEWTPTVTNGADAYASAETTALRPDVNHLGFATAADDFAQASVGFSPAWNLGTVTFQVIWSHASTSTPFGVTWVLQCVSVSNDGTIDVAFGTGVTVDDTGGTTEDLYVTAESGAVTCGGTPADDDLTYFQLFRDVSDANDDLAIGADMLGVKIFFTTDTAL